MLTTCEFLVGFFSTSGGNPHGSLAQSSTPPISMASPTQGGFEQTPDTTVAQFCRQEQCSVRVVTKATPTFQPIKQRQRCGEFYRRRFDARRWRRKSVNRRSAMIQHLNCPAVRSFACSGGRGRAFCTTRFAAIVSGYQHWRAS